jgi:hypothetical protein
VDACSNNYITGPYLEGVLCGSLIPSAIISVRCVTRVLCRDPVDKRLSQALPIHIAFGANTTWCAALACAYRGMGECVARRVRRVFLNFVAACDSQAALSRRTASRLTL